MSEAPLQAEIRRFGRLYVASSNVSHAVVRSRSRQELLDEVVRVLVEVGGFAMALVSWHDPATQELVPAARHGDVHGYADRIHMFADERPEGQGPGGTAFRSAVPYVCNEFINDPRTLPWRDAARESGWRASAAFPIRTGGSPRGLLSVYASEPGAFGPEQVELLQQVALDVAFGLEHLDAVGRQHRAEAALRETEERLRQAVRVSQIGVFDHDQTTDIVHWSPEQRRIYGWGAEEPVTLPAYLERVHPGDREKVVAAVHRAHDPAGDGLFDAEYRVLLPDGSIRWVSVRAQTFFDGEGAARRAVRTIGATRDITEQRQAEEARWKLEEQLFQAQKMESIGRLAGGVAHDFNNLLTVINGYSQFALMGLPASDPLRSSIEEIRKAGERAAGLTRQLLAFSRKQTLQPHVLDLNRVVRELQPMLERLTGEDVEVRVALTTGSAAVRADPHHLEQVIINLAVNARDAMPDGGSLLIETAGVELGADYERSHPGVSAGRYAMLAVSDTGTGMDEETRRRIFEPFFTTKPAGLGTGLGLSMVQGIVTQSGGHVGVSSQPGQGTTFRIYLPALDCLPANAEDAEESVDPAAPGGMETVLVVEDMAQVRGFAVKALRRCGYRVVEAGNADEALAICERERGTIHLVLTDVVMPGLTGTELASRLVKLRPGTKVLLMSGYTDNAIPIGDATKERIGFISKPFSPEGLAQKVRAVLDASLDPPDGSTAR